MPIKVKEYIGRTGETAYKATATIDPTIYVAIDVAKYYHKAIIFDLTKKILEQSFDFDLSKDGFNKLIERIECHATKQKVKQIAVGLESTGHYHETLVEHLRAKGYKVILFNPYVTFKTRALRLDYVKTDALDVKAIGEAMLLGEGHEICNDSDVYQHLRLLTRFRRAKNRARQSLKNQTLRDLDRLWPGLMKDSKDKKLGLFSNLWESKIARQLLKLNLLPQEIAKLTPPEFLGICHSKNMEGIGLLWAKKIVDHANQILPCETAEAFIHQQVLNINLKLLEELDTLVEDIDRKLSILLQQTPGAFLLSIQGVSFVTAAEFLGEVGDPSKYTCPGEWVKLAGLHVSRYQSGKKDRKENSITKMGNRYFRTTVFTIARNVSRWEPLFITQKDKLLSKGKHIRSAYGALANKFIRVAFYLILRRMNFDPKYENKKEKKCLTQSA